VISDEKKDSVKRLLRTTKTMMMATTRGYSGRDDIAVVD